MATAPGNNAPTGGLKVVTEHGWFAARPSGTENINKVYAESFTSQAHLAQILADAETIVLGRDLRWLGGSVVRWFSDPHYRFREFKRDWGGTTWRKASDPSAAKATGSAGLLGALAMRTSRGTDKAAGSYRIVREGGLGGEHGEHNGGEGQQRAFERSQNISLSAGSGVLSLGMWLLGARLLHMINR